MKSGIILAIVVSLFMVGGAVWKRSSATGKSAPTIITVETFGNDEESYEEYLREFLSPSEVGRAAPHESNPSAADMIGRQMIMDYIGLASSGGAGAASIDLLAERYVESIPTLNKAAVISLADIRAVPNTKGNFKNYADEITVIYKTYVESMNKARLPENNINILNPGFYSSTFAISMAYAEAAAKLKSMQVPGALAQAHLQLTNSYASSAWAMDSVSKADEDSANAFAGLIILNESVRKEEELLKEIARILTANGI
jgi:hypothetical protein